MCVFNSIRDTGIVVDQISQDPQVSSLSQVTFDAVAIGLAGPKCRTTETLPEETDSISNIINLALQAL